MIEQFTRFREAHSCEMFLLELDMQLHPREIPLLRGAINQLVNRSEELLHNHREQGFRYAYPLVQYKQIEQRPIILGIGVEGGAVVQGLLPYEGAPLRLGQRVVPLHFYAARPLVLPFALDERPHEYRVERWLPFNEENYRSYKEERSLVARCQMLERLLCAHLLAMAGGVGCQLGEQLTVSLTSLSEPRAVSRKGASLLSFDVTFDSPWLLPSFVGVGKSASHGFGTVLQLS